MGSDGLPVLAYEAGPDLDRIMLVKCGNRACSERTTVELATLVPTGRSTVAPPSLAIGTDGSPIVATYEWDGSEGHILVFSCSDPACVEVSTTTPVVSDAHPYDLLHIWSVSLTNGADGLPVLAYIEGVDGGDAGIEWQLRFALCTDFSCTTIAG